MDNLIYHVRDVKVRQKKFECDLYRSNLRVASVKGNMDGKPFTYKWVDAVTPFAPDGVGQHAKSDEAMRLTRYADALPAIEVQGVNIPHTPDGIVCNLVADYRATRK